MILYLTLAERQDGGDVVQQPRANHRFHVKDLAADALQQHREEVWVAEVQRALRTQQSSRDNIYAICFTEKQAFSIAPQFEKKNKLSLLLNLVP